MLRSGVLALISMLVLLQEVSAQDTAEKAEAGKRDPKLFYVTTQSTTSTITTASFCYTTNAALTAACKRKKKRALKHSQVEMEEEEASKILPSDVQTWTDNEAGEDRNAKFLVYWLTTTSTSTSTTYSTTSTLASLECTPSGFTLSVCG